MDSTLEEIKSVTCHKISDYDYDKYINGLKIKQRYKEREKQWIKKIKKDRKYLSKIPEGMSKLFYIKLVEYDPELVRYIPHKTLTENFIIRLITDDNVSLSVFPIALLTENICYRAIEHYIDNIKYIPVHIWTEEFALEAVKES